MTSVNNAGLREPIHQDLRHVLVEGDFAQGSLDASQCDRGSDWLGKLLDPSSSPVKRSANSVADYLTKERVSFQSLKIDKDGSFSLSV